MILELAAGAAVAGLVSLIVCFVQMMAGPVDKPDEERKAHARPTPTSGGIGIAVGYAGAVLALGEFSRSLGLAAHVAALVWMASAFAFAFLLIGFVDDTRPLGPRIKLFLFTLLSLGAAITMGVVDVLPVGAGQTLRLGLSLGLFGTALWVFTLVNCVNFMDGAHGLAIGSTAIGLVSLGLIGFDAGISSVTVITFCCAGALAGFLGLNFPSGRIFAGDSGALFAGALAAITSLILIARGDLSPFIPPLLFMPLLADALLTLAWRVRHRRKLLVGHQEHFYQIAIRAGWQHWQITLLYWAAMAACGGLGFWLSRLDDSQAPWVALTAVAGLSLAISILVRKYARTHGMSPPTI